MTSPRNVMAVPDTAISRRTMVVPISTVMTLKQQ
jgi:hypothetical protein